MLGDVHPHGYWLMPEKEYRFDKRLASSIANLATKRGVRNILDIGCGNGAYTFYLQLMGFDVEGIDGNPHTSTITHGACREVDVANHVDLGTKDMILCLEVAEHIPKERQGVFIHNITDSSPKIIVLSWAVEGQGGLGHINCRNNDYVINLFSNYDYTYLEKESLALRKHSRIKWFKNTLMAYERLSGSPSDV